MVSDYVMTPFTWKALSLKCSERTWQAVHSARYATWSFGNAAQVHFRFAVRCGIILD